MSLEIVQLDSDDVLLNQLVIAAEAVLGDDQVTVLNILTLCVNLMQIVEKYTRLKGAQKKELVIKALETLVLKKGGNNTNLMALIPSFIDNAVSISNGQLRISVKPEDNTGCCVGLFGKQKNKNEL